MLSLIRHASLHPTPLHLPLSLSHPLQLSYRCVRYITTDHPFIFDRLVSKKFQKHRAVLLPDADDYTYLKLEVLSRLLDRLDDICSHKFHTVLELGASLPNATLSHLSLNEDVQHLVQMDTSLPSLCGKPSESTSDSDEYRLKPWRVVGDEENLPFKPDSFDLILSNLSLHWVNDLPSCLSQCCEVLKEDGLFLASMFGEGTLEELRNAFIIAEQERHGGISPHISPLVTIGDMGSLLTRAGFNLITIDQESIVAHYSDAFILMRDLQNMAENNAISNRRPVLPLDTAFSAASIYESMYGNNGQIPATFNVIYLCGWKPHNSQMKPKRRASATISLKDLGKVFKSEDGRIIK